MQSSPPTRAWDRPASPSESDFSLDLAKLDLEPGSGDSTPLPQPKVDRVFSEDMEGPSDFTLNMEAYINGRRAKGLLASLKERDAKIELKGRGTGDIGASEVPQRGDALVESEPTASHHTPTNSPPKSSLMWSVPPGSHETQEHEHENMDDREPTSSEWNLYSEASAPPHSQLLQPTVEDYYSEITPARFPSTQTQSTTRVGDVSSPLSCRSRSSGHSEPSADGCPSSPTNPPVRSPVINRSHLSRGAMAAEMEDLLRQLRERCRQLESLNSSLSQALDEERRVRRQEKVTYEARLSEAAKLQDALAEAKEAKDESFQRGERWKSAFAEQENNAQNLGDRATQQAEQIQHLQADHAEEMQDLRRQAEKQECDHADEVRGLRQRIEGQQQDHLAQLDKLRYRTSSQQLNQAPEIQQLEAQLERQKAQHSQHIRELEHSLDLVRRNRDNAEETARELRKDLDKYSNANDAELDRMQLELDQAHGAGSEIDELREQVRAADKKMQRLQSEVADAQHKAMKLQAELDSMHLTRNNETSRTDDDHRRALELAENLQRRMRELQQKLNDQQASHDAEIKRLQTSHEQSHDIISDELNNIRADNDAKQAALNSALVERDAFQDDLASLRAELNAVKAALEMASTSLSDSEAVNAALDARISDVMRKREAHWRGRLEESENERKVMVKALLHQWGREELGRAMPQGYEYMSVQRRVGVAE